MAQLIPNLKKTVEALLYLMELAGARRLDRYQLGKALFFADRNHLEAFGRPITFCNYSAMKDGPVPSEAYDLLKGKPWPGSASLEVPWSVEPVRGKIYQYAPARSADVSKLSKSDLAMLKSAYEFVKDKKFDEIRNLTHGIDAYAEAWERRGDKNSVWMKLELLTNNDAELVSDLVHASRYST
jgi:Protein of unknown function (DUF4065)